MLKKAGIVIAATTCSLLMLSPLAFAGDGHGGRHHDDDHDGHGLINVSDLGIQVPVQLCGNDIASGVLGVLSRGQRNESNDDTDCEQDSDIDND